MRVARGRMGRGRLSLLQRYTAVGDSHTRSRFVCAQYILSHFRRLPGEFQLFPRMMHAPETVPAVCEASFWTNTRLNNGCVMRNLCASSVSGAAH